MPGPGEIAERYAGAPVVSPARAVPGAWIDYNGHMNVAYYTMAFDQAADHLFDEVLDIGERSVRERGMGPYVLQNHLHYVGELLEGEAFRVEMRLLDWDAKRIHVFSEMRNEADGRLAATSETLSANVDLTARRVAPYPEDAMARIAALGESQAGLPRPDRAGAPIGIRRKG